MDSYRTLKAPNGETKDVLSIGILEETILSTRNICSFSGNWLEEEFWFWLTGGLNTQIEHHLFPMMPRCNLRKMTADVKKTLNENDLQWKESDLGECITNCVIPLRQNVIRNMVRLGRAVMPGKKEVGIFWNEKDFKGRVCFIYHLNRMT